MINNCEGGVSVLLVVGAICLVGSSPVVGGIIPIAYYAVYKKTFLDEKFIFIFI